MTKTWYITKYALIGGIKQIEAAAKPTNDDPSRQWVKKAGDWNWYYVGKEAFDTLDAAIADANERRTRKIVSLKKQIAKLEKADFSQVSA